MVSLEYPANFLKNQNHLKHSIIQSQQLGTVVILMLNYWLLKTEAQE